MQNSFRIEPLGGRDQSSLLHQSNESAPDGNVERYLIRDHGSIAGRFSVEISEVGVSTWRPRILGDLLPSEEQGLFDEVVQFLPQLARRRARSYVETMLKTGPSKVMIGRPDPWRTSLLLHGFRVVAEVGEWVREIRASDRAALDVDVERGSKWNVTEEDATFSSALHKAYFETLVGSLDRISIFEAAHGEGFGEFDLAYVAHSRDGVIGMCVCLLEAPGEGGWVKYIGVKPAWRRRGIAFTLVEKAIQVIALRGGGKLRVLIDLHNVPSARLHQSLGFSEVEMYGEAIYAEIRI